MKVHLPLTLSLHDEQGIAVDSERIRDVARRTAHGEGARGEISILLVHATRIAELNAEYLGCSGPTDVLSFPVDGLVDGPAPDGGPAGGPGPVDGPPVLIGEIVLCPEVAAEQAPEGPDGVPDLGAELDLLVAHGVLHLLGYDHDTDE